MSDDDIPTTAELREMLTDASCSAMGYDEGAAGLRDGLEWAVLVSEERDKLAATLDAARAGLLALGAAVRCWCPTCGGEAGGTRSAACVVCGGPVIVTDAQGVGLLARMSALS